MFVIDECLPPSIAEGMAAFGEHVVWGPDLPGLGRGVKDLDLIPVLGLGSHALITVDDRMRWNRAEQAALRAHGVRAFFLQGKKVSLCQRVQQLVRAWPAIKAAHGSPRAPILMQVRTAGGVAPFSGAGKAKKKQRR